ncbi:MAG: NAD(P)-dependent oxidoreductase [Bacteroidaceae bacterium]|nr:NAD(P)-dependent oxidoreductase [Bacteroidaceae bacterium]
MSNILVTGASGFIGSFIVEEAIKKGFSTWAGVRKSSSKEYLQDPSMHFIDLDYAHPVVLQQQLVEHANSNGAFTYVVHCAGVTKCADKRDFDKVNYQQTKNLIDALIATGQTPKLFVFISTLSVFGPIHENNYQPITEHDQPQPNTAYGKSKLKAEQYLQGLTNFPYLILRPTGVYGPREKDYFLMAKSILQHIDFSVGYKRQDITFVYVKDIVQAIFLGIEKGVSNRAFFLSDGKVYQSRTFSNLIIRELKATKVLRICAPLWVLKIVSVIAEKWAKLRHTSSTLNTDKYRIMKQRNWRCDITPAINELGYNPQYQLDKGVKETIAWYKEAGWL